MIAPDANLLIYSYNSDAPAPLHNASRKWLEALFSGSEHVGIPVLSLHAFLRFVTHPKLLKRPASLAEGSAIVNSWLALPHVRILYPGDRHWQIFQQICQPVNIRGAKLTDAAIAAIAMEYGAVVHTHDRDFARFPGLRWHDPLQPGKHP